MQQGCLCGGERRPKAQPDQPPRLTIGNLLAAAQVCNGATQSGTQALGRDAKFFQLPPTAPVNRQRAHRGSPRQILSEAAHEGTSVRTREGQGYGTYTLDLTSGNARDSTSRRRVAAGCARNEGRQGVPRSPDQATGDRRGTDTHGTFPATIRCRARRLPADTRRLRAGTAKTDRRCTFSAHNRQSAPRSSSRAIRQITQRRPTADGRCVQFSRDFQRFSRRCWTVSDTGRKVSGG
jgi:hypothetical protein